MMGKKMLVTQKGCGGCADVKAALKEEISRGDIEEVDAESAKGETIAEELNLDMVPECVEEVNGKYKKCNLDKLLKGKPGFE